MRCRLVAGNTGGTMKLPLSQTAKYSLAIDAGTPVAPGRGYTSCEAGDNQSGRPQAPVVTLIVAVAPPAPNVAFVEPGATGYTTNRAGHAAKLSPISTPATVGSATWMERPSETGFGL